MKELLTVGEISRLFDLNVQTLHYYDSIGIFKPACRDPETGYRRYLFDQVYQLASIRYLRLMGYSLQEIRRYLQTRNPQDTVELLKERSALLRQQWGELMRVDDAIQRKISFIERKTRTLDVSAVEVRWFPDRRYIPIGSEEHLYMEDSFYFYPTIAFYEKGLKYFGAYLEAFSDGVSEEHMPLDLKNTSVIPAGRYLVGYHCGPYETVEQRFEDIRNSRPDLPLSPKAINFNIIDQFVERHSEKYITEIQFPIEDDVQPPQNQDT